MTKSPKRWIAGFIAYKTKRLGNRRKVTIKLQDRIAADYLRLIVKTEIHADRAKRIPIHRAIEHFK